MQRYNSNHPDQQVINNLALKLHIKPSSAADVISQFEYDVRIALKKEPFVVVCQGRIITPTNYLNAEHCKDCDIRYGCKEYTKLSKHRNSGNNRKEP